MRKYCLPDIYWQTSRIPFSHYRYRAEQLYISNISYTSGCLFFNQDSMRRKEKADLSLCAPLMDREYNFSLTSCKSIRRSGCYRKSLLYTYRFKTTQIVVVRAWRVRVYASTVSEIEHWARMRMSNDLLPTSHENFFASVR